MAGSVPDVLAHRMVLDVDGARLATNTGVARTDLPVSAVAIVNSEGPLDLGPDSTIDAYLLVFPELRDIAGLYLGFTLDDPASYIDVHVEASSDTTTGHDGTWTEVVATDRQPGGMWSHVDEGDYRRYVQPCTATAVRALRVTITPQTPGTTVWHLRYLHAYGAHATGQNINRVQIWDPTLDQRVAPGYFDWGNVPLGSSAEKTFRVKNLSPTWRADAIVLSVDALTDAVPSVAAQHLLSYAGSAYAASVTIPSLLPGAISGLVTMRRVTPSTAVPGVWAQRVKPHVTTWVVLS